MTLANRIFRPFETLVRPLDLPARPLPDDGPLKLIGFFASMFRGLLLVVGLLSVISALIALTIVWALAFIVDGVTTEGPRRSCATMLGRWASFSCSSPWSTRF